MRAPDLVLLTAAFPFGSKSETFLESEIEVLARRFQRVFVLPSHREEGLRRVPASVRLVEMTWLEEAGRRRRRRALAGRRALRALTAQILAARAVRAYLRVPRMYLDVLARNVLKAEELVPWIRREGLRGAVFYDYWFENSTLALAMLRRDGPVRTAVCRAHGFDIYDERWNGWPVPFRELKAAWLDRVFPVSKSGAQYLGDRLGPRTRHKIETAYLGVARSQPGEVTASSRPLILTCSSLAPHKRVHLVPPALAALGRPVRWVHLGDGPERGRVASAAKNLPSRVEWRLEGHVDNPDVLRFYERNRVDVLLSLSVSEGLPVSMMEAASHGVPIVAVGVHGVPEIVREQTGLLLDADASPSQVAERLKTALEPGRFSSEAIRQFQRDHFDAETNFDRFADGLIALQEAETTAV